MDTKKTQDIYFTAAILALGGKLENTDKSDPRHMVFEVSLNKQYEFKSENLQGAYSGITMSYPARTLDDYEKDWANGVLMINAVQFKDALQRMKAVVHSR